LKLLLKIRPSTIHIVLPFPPRSFSFILAATNSLIPVTITFQLVPSPARLPIRYFKLFRSVLPRVTLCTVSRSNQVSIANALDVPVDTIQYIPNRPLPCSGYLSAEEKNCLLADLNLDSSHFICTTVAALERRKGHEDIIHACNILITADCPIRFLFIGTGQHQSYLKSLVTSLGLDDYIFFAGSRSDVDSILQISHVFIFPSSAEGLSFALMEAVQRNVPLIASNRCGADDFLNPLVHFKGYEYGNASQLAQHILLTHDLYQHSLNSAQLASSVLCQYDFDAMCQSTVEILFR
jgi:glycosyltransferase involved in cell wall biosynthesis